MNKKIYLFSFLSGFLFPLAFAPFNWPLGIYLSTCCFYYLLQISKNRIAGRIGFFYGLGKFGLGVSWVFVSIENFSELHWSFSVLITIGFVCLLSLYDAITAKFFSSVNKNVSSIKNCFIFAALLTMAELLRASLLSGFPWLLAGHSQLNTPLSLVSPITGSYGVSFICYLISAFIANAFLIPQKKTTQNYIYCSLIIAPFALCQICLPLHWGQTKGSPLQVSLLQGNITHETKWHEEQLDETLETYSKLTMSRLEDDIIIWPETALPMPNIYALDIFSMLSQDGIKHQTQIVLGAPGMNDDGTLSNSIFMLGENLGRYDKQHLVPFGEYMPIEFLHPLYRWFNVPFSELSQGTHAQDLFSIKNVVFAPFICFEIAFNNALQRDRIKRSNAILTITDDSWFGHSFAKAQHLQIAQMRSLETARPQLFASNDGLSAIIDPQGKITFTMPGSVKGYLHGDIQGQIGNTPFLNYGNMPVIVFLILIILSAFMPKIKNYLRAQSQ